MKMPSEKIRAYIYSVSVAAVPVLILTGVLSESDVVAYLGLLAAVLGLSLARANVTTKE